MRYNYSMFSSFPRLRLAVIFLTCLLPFSLGADSFWDDIHWSYRSGLLFFSADNGPGADPAPILPSGGFSAAWQFWGPLRLELTEDIYFANYEYNTALGYAMACNSENRSAFVMGFLSGIQLTGVFPIGENAAVRVFGGPVADFRLVVLAFGLNHPGDFTGNIETDAGLQTDAIRDYFWNNGRWIFPVLGAGMDFPINEKFLLGFDMRLWFPFYRLWTDKALPAADGWRFGIGLRITPRKTSR